MLKAAASSAETVRIVCDDTDVFVLLVYWTWRKTWIMVPDCSTNFRNGFATLDNPYKVVLDDSLVHLDEKLNILAAILAVILNSGDRIATPTSGLVFQPLITHTKWY